MHFQLTEEQEALARKTKELMAQEIMPFAETHRSNEALPKEAIKNLLKKTIPLGALGNVIPREMGGAGMDHITWGLVYEQLDRAINSVIMISSGTAHAIAHLGTKRQQEKYLPGLLNAELIGCSAITEPNVGSNPRMVETTAEPKGDHYVVNGTKVFITNGVMADLAIVLATVDPSLGAKGLIRILIDKSQSPFAARSIPVLGDKGHLGELTFDNCIVPKENLLGSIGRGLSATMKAFQRARCFVALTGIHLMQLAIDASIRHVREAQASGKELGGSQLIHQMIADMMAQKDAARLLAFRALSLIDEGVQKNAASSMAKFFATEAAVQVTSNAIQIHGFHGLTTDYPIEEYHRQARMLTIPDGTTQIQKLIVGREALGQSAFT
ncbi:MAG: acyl-CoA dehydrogenase [Desulfobacteraceae bacterium]|nr:MAG: acyl-CoA dehydrogenase [Desulfobacteraceae bacterium]